MSAILPVENSEVGSGCELDRLSHDTLVFGKNLFSKCVEVYPNGWSQTSAEAEITNQFFLYQFLRGTYRGFPPPQFRDKYHEVEQTLSEAHDNPDVQDNLVKAEEILLWAKAFTTFYKPEIPESDQYLHIYSVFASIVDPLLVKIGDRECSSFDVMRDIAEAEAASADRLVPQDERIYNRFDLAGAKSSNGTPTKIPPNRFIRYMSDRHSFGSMSN